MAHQQNVTQLPHELQELFLQRLLQEGTESALQGVVSYAATCRTLKGVVSSFPAPSLELTGGWDHRRIARKPSFAGISLPAVCMISPPNPNERNHPALGCILLDVPPLPPKSLL